MSLRHRRLEPGPDIAPLTVAELDQVHAYCRAQVTQILASQPLLDDQGLKEAILNQEDCPELIKRVSLDRPSVFDILCSKSRYKPELFALQRSLLVKLESKTASESAVFQELFKTLIPNSSTIIRNLQKQAHATANIQ